MSTPLKAILIQNAEFGSVNSRADYSVKFAIITPLDGADAELVEVTTEAERKTPSQRLRACLHVWWQQLGKNGSFNHFYDDQMEKLITFVKTKLQP